MRFTKRYAINQQNNTASMTNTSKFFIDIVIDGIYQEDAIFYLEIFSSINEIDQTNINIDDIKNEIISKIQVIPEDPSFYSVISDNFWNKASGYILLNSILKDIANDDKYSVKNITDLVELIEYNKNKRISLEDVYDLFVFQHSNIQDYIAYKRSKLEDKTDIICKLEQIHNIDVKKRFERMKSGFEILDLITPENDQKYMRETNNKIDKMVNDGTLTKEQAAAISTINWENHKKLLEISKSTKNNNNNWINDPILGPNSEW